MARLSSAKAATAVQIRSLPLFNPGSQRDFLLIMLTTEEIQFLKYWEQNSKKKKKSIWQFSIGLPLGVLIVASLFVNIITGWHKKAAMVLYSHSSLILVVLIAAVSIVVFITVFTSRHRWEMQEQQYQELLVKQQTEKEAANVSET